MATNTPRHVSKPPVGFAGRTELDPLRSAQQTQPFDGNGSTVSDSQRSLNGRRGATVVEFTVVAPVFFLLVFGLIEFSRMVMCYQVMTSAAREAARAGAIPGATSS